MQSVNSGSVSTFQNYIELEKYLGEILANISPNMIILCIDEFDNILNALHQIGDDYEAANIISIIDNLIANRNDLPIVLNLTMTNLPREISLAYHSPGFSKTEQIRLAPLSITESKELVTCISAARFSFSPISLFDIYRLTYGHPYLLNFY